MAVSHTGKYRFRTGWRGVLVLQIEVAGTEAKNMGNHISMEDVRYWRDARSEDVTTDMVKDD